MLYTYISETTHEKTLNLPRNALFFARRMTHDTASRWVAKNFATWYCINMNKLNGHIIMCISYNFAHRNVACLMYARRHSPSTTYKYRISFGHTHIQQIRVFQPGIVWRTASKSELINPVVPWQPLRFNMDNKCDILWHAKNTGRSASQNTELGSYSI